MQQRLCFFFDNWCIIADLSLIIHYVVLHELVIANNQMKNRQLQLRLKNRDCNLPSGVATEDSRMSTPSLLILIQNSGTRWH